MRTSIRDFVRPWAGLGPFISIIALVVGATSVRGEDAAPSRCAWGLGGVGVGTSGDRDKWLEDFGAKSGFTLDALRCGRDDERSAFSVDVRWLASEEGALRGAFEGTGGWKLRVGLDQYRKWSDTSVGPPVTSFGTPLDQFYPGDNTIRAAFGNREVVSRRRSAWLDLSFPTGTFGTIVLGGERLEQEGTLTLVSRGSTFADDRLLAFNTPALANLDLGTNRGFLRGDFLLGDVTLSAAASFEKRSDDVLRTYPTFGTGSLLDLTSLGDRFDTRTTRAELAGSYPAGPATLFASGSWTRSKAEPSSTRSIDAPDGASLGSRSTSGTRTDARNQTTSLGAVVEATENLVFRLGVTAGKETSSGSGAETRFDNGATDPTIWNSSARRETRRTTAKGEATWSGAGIRATLGYDWQARERDSESVIEKSPAIFPARYAETSDRDSTRGRAYFRLRVPLGAAHRLLVGIDRTKETTDLELGEIENEYATGEVDRTGWRAFADAQLFRTGATSVSLRYDGAKGKDELGAPVFDPIYDPSRTPGGTRFDHDKHSVDLRAFSSNERLSGWASVGWRKETGEFSPALATFAGFAATTWKTSGPAVSAGGAFAPWPSGSFDANVFWMQTRDSVANDRLEAGVGYRHDFSDRIGLVARYRWARFDERRFGTDDYRGNVGTILLVGRF